MDDDAVELYGGGLMVRDDDAHDEAQHDATPVTLTQVHLAHIVEDCPCEVI